MHRPSLHPEGVKMPREVDRRCPEMQSKERTPLTSTRLFSWICSEQFLLCKSQHTHSTAKMQAWPGKWTGQVWTLPKGNTQWYQMPQLLLSKQEPESSPHLRLSHQTLNTAYEVKPWGSFTFVTRQNLCRTSRQEPQRAEEWERRWRTWCLQGTDRSWCCRAFLEAQGLCRVCAAPILGGAVCFILLPPCSAGPQALSTARVW